MNLWIEKAGLNVREWSSFKKVFMTLCVLTFVVSNIMFLTPAGAKVRNFLAGTVIETQHRDWAWIFVGKEQRDAMVQRVIDATTANGNDPQNKNLVSLKRKSLDELIHVEDISGPKFKGKMMWVYDPKSIRLVVPYREPGGPQMGERITEMVKRTGAVAGVNAGGFDDPDGLGNGFAPIGMLMSNSEVLYGASSGKQPIVGFDDEGFLVVGNYTLDELKAMKVKEAASFYPRVILDGMPLPVDDVGINPRTAVGQKADGTVIFIVIDGRQWGYSLGATLKAVQDLFLKEGVINAGFLDGGASSELVVNGELLTKPSSKYGERRLPSAFLVFDNPDAVVVENPWAGLTEIDPGGASTHPEYLADKAREKENAARNPKPTPTPTPKTTATPKPTLTPAVTATPKSTAKPGTTGSPVPTTPDKQGVAPSPTASGAPEAVTDKPAGQQ